MDSSLFNLTLQAHFRPHFRSAPDEHLLSLFYFTAGEARMHCGEKSFVPRERTFSECREKSDGYELKALALNFDRTVTSVPSEYLRNDRHYFL